MHWTVTSISKAMNYLTISKIFAMIWCVPWTLFTELKSICNCLYWKRNVPFLRLMPNGPANSSKEIHNMQMHQALLTYFHVQCKSVGKQMFFFVILLKHTTQFTEFWNDFIAFNYKLYKIHSIWYFNLIKSQSSMYYHSYRMVQYLLVHLKESKFLTLQNDRFTI